jgi:hypothetical protein
VEVTALIRVGRVVGAMSTLLARKIYGWRQEFVIRHAMTAYLAVRNGGAGYRHH